MKQKFQKLEMLRGFAALYVFAGHFLIVRVLPKDSKSGLPFRFGQEAVMLFFIISGFVVYYSTAKHKDSSFLPYFVRRARRIFPIYLLALALSFVTVVLLGHTPASKFSFAQLLGNVFMLQDFSGGKPGVWVAPFCINYPLWSLSYEWWFYMMFFPIYRMVTPQRQIDFVAALSFLGFVTFSLCPNQLSLFLLYYILWWSGAELARCYLKQVPLTIASQGRTLCYLGVFTALVATPIMFAAARHQALSFGMHPLLEFRHFSACLFFLLIGLLWARLRWVGFSLIFGVFTLAAPISYALYVFHYPLAVSSTYLDGINPPFLRLTGYVLVTILVAYLAEIPFQHWINRKTRSLGRSSGKPTQQTASGVSADA